ncbi:MAG: hypothetical protein RMK84_08100 [Oscillochloridaceae bacterium]|nr:hypothetical protein [Chloroflexaceae bacterium]MDW8390074.1 hypothetical protein [Oscillochloridaceae bacterium]
MVRVKLIVSMLLAAALAACVAPAAPVATPAPNNPTVPPEEAALLEVQTALERGDYAAAVEMLGAPVSPAHIALLVRARIGLTREIIAAAPGDAQALRAALDQVGLALALRPDDAALRDELLGLERALVALLAVEDRRQALLAGEPDANDVAALDMARTLAGRAVAAVAGEPRLPGAEQIAANGLLAAAAVFERSGDGAADDRASARWQEARGFCEQAIALQASDAARSCLERLASKLNPPASAAAPATPAAATLPLRRPTPAPRPPARSTGPAFSVVQRKSFDGSGNSGQFASCIDIQVLGPGGPIPGAVLGINNGEHSYQNQTDASGYTGRCGLGASTWSVVLFWTPQTGSVSSATTTVYLNGAPEQRAAVVFRSR